MKPIIIYSDKILDRLSWFFKVGGISLFPFIILRERYKGTVEGEETVTHETIHFKQALETLIIGFYIIYAINFVINLFIYSHHVVAYKNILFEKEAYNNQGNKDYLAKRRLFAWITD